MIDSTTLEPLQTRRAAIQKKRAELEAKRAKLRREDQELGVELHEIEVTLKTLSRVYGLDEVEVTTPLSPPKVNGASTSTKPPGTPTVFDMVQTILTDAQFFAVDQVWLEGEEIYGEIQRRWWPNAPRNSIIPSLWRFYNEHRLLKEGTKYALLQQADEDASEMLESLQKDEASGAGTPDASESEGELEEFSF